MVDNHATLNILKCSVCSAFHFEKGNMVVPPNIVLQSFIAAPQALFVDTRKKRGEGARSLIPTACHDGGVEI
jgi:hypothetical protein